MLTTDELAAISKDLYKFTRDDYKQVELVYPKIYKIVSGVSGGGDKRTQRLDSKGLTQHTSESQDIGFSSPRQGWQQLTAYKTFSDGVDFSKNMIDDVVKAEVGNRIKSYTNTWGESLRNDKETFAANFFNYGGKTSGNAMFDGSWGDETDSSGNLIYDGFPLFNLTGNARSSKGGGTYYNAVSTGALNPANFETLWILITKTNSYSELDKKISNKVDTLLVEEGSDYLMGRRICETPSVQGYPGGQLNDINVLQGLAKVVPWSYLSGGAWYIGKAQTSALEFHERQKPEIRFWRREENLGYRASINVRFGVWIKNWRQWGRIAGSYSAS